jgi:hypothetical protein
VIGWLKSLFALGAVRVVRLKPGDKIILYFPGVLTADQADRLRADWARFFGASTPALVLENGARLEVLRGAGGEKP